MRLYDTKLATSLAAVWEDAVTVHTLVLVVQPSEPSVHEEKPFWFY